MTSRAYTVQVAVPLAAEAFGIDAHRPQERALQWAGPAGGCMALPGGVAFLKEGTYILGYAEDGRAMRVTCQVNRCDGWTVGNYRIATLDSVRAGIPASGATTDCVSLSYPETVPRRCAVVNGMIQHGRTEGGFAVTYNSRGSEALTVIVM
jgi:hypothetical protein